MKLIDQHQSGRVEVSIEDCGRGIPPEILAKVGQEGFSYDKGERYAGSGLGVFHAKKMLENWGGWLKIESQVGIGTKVTVSLPEETCPDWFVQSLEVPHGFSVGILDDDPSIHEVWKSKFLAEQSLIHWKSPQEMRAWILENGVKNIIFLLDYDLGVGKQTGLDMIEEYKLSRNAILVTGLSEDHLIVSRCQDKNVRVLPKKMARFLPIVFTH